MGQRKAINLAQSGADVVALCDVSCMTHMNGILARQAQHCRAVHIAEVLNNQIDVAPTTPAEEAAPVIKPRRWQDI
jgi:L-lactate dehydrogenase complex protein LldE